MGRCSTRAQSVTKAEELVERVDCGSAEVAEKFGGGLALVSGIVKELEEFVSAEVEVVEEPGVGFVLVGEVVEGLDDRDVSVEVITGPA